MLRLHLICLALVVLLSLASPAGAQEVTVPFDLERVQRATVFILQAQNTGNNLQVTCISTGTIVNRNGLILSNAHSTVPSADCPGDTLIVELSVRLDNPPVLQYRAVLDQYDAGLDLALLRITQDVDGRLIDPSTLSLPFVELADSTTVELDDTITIVGYPGIGNEPIAVTRGTISGFVAEPSGGNRSWIKTSAAIPGTMSGGGAYNQLGQLIGIPTTVPVTAEAGTRACIWDTNGDGLVNTSDRCIPVGDDINALRPSNFARPLLRAASLGLTVESLTSTAPQSAGSGTPSFRRLFFSPSVNDAGMPTTVLRSLPAGSNSLYLFFDYRNMTPETVYSLRVTTDGIPNPTFSLSPVRWSGGSNGMWYLGSSGQPWPNGVYEFTLFANGVAAETARLVIGGAPDPTPAFSDITFGLLDLQGNVLGNGFVLPTGNVANAEFLFRNMADGMRWTAIWYYNNEEVFRTPEDNTWVDGVSGRKTISISVPTGLLPGNYRLELYIEDRLATTSDFIIAGAQEGVFPRIFSDTHFTSAATPEEAARAPVIRNFAAGTNAVYAVFDWQQLAPGTPWTMRWLIDGEVFYQQRRPWVGPETGSDYLVRLNAPGGVPDGTYRLELFVGAIQLVGEDVRVGIGQLPIDRFAQTTGAQLRGQVVDSETGEGLPGVTVVLLSEEYSVSDFTWSEDQIYDMAVTDLDGRFQINRLLEYSTEDRPVPYSAVVVANGYLPLTADGLEVTTENGNVVDLTLYMTRD